MQLWLDFNIGKSIVKVRNGEFYLKPYIRLFITKATGSIEGRVTPSDAYAVVSVYNAADTAYAIPYRDGKFKVRGLSTGCLYCLCKCIKRIPGYHTFGCHGKCKRGNRIAKNRIT